MGVWKSHFGSFFTDEGFFLSCLWSLVCFIVYLWPWFAHTFVLGCGRGKTSLVVVEDSRAVDSGSTFTVRREMIQYQSKVNHECDHSISINLSQSSPI